MDASRRQYYGIPEDMLTCPCGEEDYPGEGCTYFVVGYPYCAGCGEHHRTPVTTDAAQPCPVDVVGLA